MKNKVVTIGVPVYNGEKFIKETLESILNQTYKNLEIIVSDNLSTDNTVNIVKEFMKKDNRIRLNINPTNLGFSGNLNKIIELATSEYIALYHADDVYEPIIVEEQVKFLDENEELAGCFTLGKMIDENGKYLENDFFLNTKNLKINLIIDKRFFINKFLEKGNILICPTSMIRKKVYQTVGGYDLHIKYIEDQDAWIRILERYNLGIISRNLIRYRVHSNQGSSYYIDKTRRGVPVHLEYFQSYFEKNLDLKFEFQILLNKRISKDCLNIAKNCLIHSNFEEAIDVLKKSKVKYKFPFLSKHGFFQRLENLLVYVIRVKRIFL